MQKLSPAKLEYILYHLNLNISIDLSTSLKTKIRYGEIAENAGGAIIFPASNKPLDYRNLIYINQIPVLFPISKIKQWYKFDEKNNLIFHHDILKSAFYLLSGYQEYKNKNHYDSLGRFQFHNSIQKRLNIIHNPVVNKYFDIIIEGLREFCLIHNISLERKYYFNEFAFFLSHDIDRVDQYHFWEVLLKTMQWAGIKPTLLDKTNSKEVAKDAILSFLRLKPYQNDFWNFEWLLHLESKLGINASYYFLDKEGLHKNSRYRFTEKRIKKLMSQIAMEKHEVGLHGTIQSANNVSYMQKCFNRLDSNTKQDIIGVRQHYLRFFMPHTAKIQHKTGLKYDTSLTFPSHEGFRNNYCLPFKLFDFEHDTMLDLWEIPLTAMDGTLFYYRELEFNEILDITHKLIDEIKPYNGVFSLLWHNSHFDEMEFPGITNFYTEYLQSIMDHSPEALTGKDIIHRIEENT